MDALGTIQPILPQALPVPSSHSEASAPAIPLPAPQPAPAQAQALVKSDAPQQPDFNLQAAEQKRQQAVRQAAQDIANVYVVSDRRFTIFKDTTGQYITRFTSLRDGKVTYIPEPDLFKMSHSSPQINVNIKA